MSKIITFFNADGSGQQALFSVNTAIALAQMKKQKVLLIDLGDPAACEAEALLNAPAARTMDTLLPLLDSLDNRMLASYLPQDRSGITFISGVKGGGELPLQQISRCIAKLSGCFPFIIINLPKENAGLLPSVFESSDEIVLPVMPHLLAVRRARSFLGLFESWHFPMAMLRILALDLKTTGSLPRDAIAEILNVPVSAEIPFNDEMVIPSINHGSPAVQAAPHSDFSLALRDFCLQLSIEDASPGAAPAVSPDKSNNVIDATRLLSFKREIHRDLIDRLDVNALKSQGITGEQLVFAVRNKAREIIQNSIAHKDIGLSREERIDLIEVLLNEALGLGCIEPLLKDPGITEIMINGPEKVYIERNGRIERTEACFDSTAQLMTVIDRIVSPLGRRVDESSPLVDARLADGSRVNVIIPPLALNGPAVTIRKFSKKKLLVDDLIALGTLSPAMAEFLRLCVQLRKNIVISGGTGSGKTTLLNVISSFIPAGERIVTIEDSAELQLPQEHVVRLESRPTSLEGTGDIPIRRLVINALRMRPDRIVVGECRGGETLDMLQAMNTGHDGSLTTIHANSTKDSLTRLTTMAMMAGMDLTEQAIKDQIISAIQCIVQLNRLPDGTRKITEIAELRGTKPGMIEPIPIFRFEQTSFNDGKVSGRHMAAGTVPLFMDGIEKYGFILKKDLFSKGENDASPA